MPLSVTWSRCTIQKECTQGLLARSWIGMSEGPQQCPSMTLTPPEISVSADIKVRSSPSMLPSSITPIVKYTGSWEKNMIGSNSIKEKKNTNSVCAHLCCQELEGSATSDHTPRVYLMKYFYPLNFQF